MRKHLLKLIDADYAPGEYVLNVSCMTSKDHYVKKYVDVHNISFSTLSHLVSIKVQLLYYTTRTTIKLTRSTIIGSPVKWMGAYLTSLSQMHSVAQDTHSSGSKRMTTASNNQILSSRVLALFSWSRRRCQDTTITDNEFECSFIFMSNIL